MTNQDTYFFSESLANEIPELPQQSIVSRTIFQDEQLKVILFGFAEGQELSEHTASVPAMIHILEGQARLSLGKDSFDVGLGAWAHMPANLSHSIFAKSPVKMLLIMLR